MFCVCGSCLCLFVFVFVFVFVVVVVVVVVAVFVFVFLFVFDCTLILNSIADFFLTQFRGRSIHHFISNGN